VSALPILAPAPEHEISPGPVPTFSVIIPAYQAAAFVAGAVASALDQTVPPLEVVVCDDGSTDDIDGALAPFRDRIVLVRQENRGLPAAKNAAAKVARGDFVAVLDADDVYLPERLAALGELGAARPDLDIITTDVFIESDGVVIARLSDNNPFEADDQRAAILQRNFIWSGAAVRRARLLELGGFDEDVDCGEDWDCWRRLLFAGSRIGMVDVPLAHYRIRAGSMSANPARDLRGQVDVLRRALAADGLTPRERAIGEATLRATLPRAAHATAIEAIRSGTPSARRDALALARTPGVRLRRRAAALAAAVWPSAAKRVLDRRHDGAPDPRARTGPATSNG
jgi:hypothetical protein